nr:hypothetical protein [Streptomyces albiflavescens]
MRTRSQAPKTSPNATHVQPTRVHQVGLAARRTVSVRPGSRSVLLPSEAASGTPLDGSMGSPGRCSLGYDRWPMSGGGM